ERWASFAGGTINAQDDIAFVANTTLPDDPQTGINENTPRRGVYARRGNTLYELARFGNPSPIKDAFNQPVPWASLFDSVAADRDIDGGLRVTFSGQLGGTDDHRFGIFRWSNLAQLSTGPLVMSGDPSPSGGSFFSV